MPSMEKFNERISDLEKELSATKYNKRTQHAVGLLKAKIAKLKEKKNFKSGKGKKSEGYAVKKSGDATVVMIGFPSVGKSTLLNVLTNAESVVGSYEFTTLKVVPGLLNFNSARIQILDVPGIIHGAASGKGKGKEVLAVANNADLILILLDVFHPEHLNIIKKELYDADIRLDKKEPHVKISKKAHGGIVLGSTVKLTKMNNETAKAILNEFKLNNVDVIFREDVSVDEFIDVIEGNKKYVPSIIVLNKVDLVDSDYLKSVKTKIKPHIAISAENKQNIEELKIKIFEKLNLIRIYCKEVGKEADYNEPLIVPKGADLRYVCLKLHKDFVNKFKFARVWGKSVKFDGQKVLKLKHKIEDKDVVEIHLH